MSDWFGSGAVSPREQAERTIAEAIRRTKIEAKNDVNFVPPADDASSILAGRHFVLPPTTLPPRDDDASSILAARAFLRGAMVPPFGVLIAPHMTSPVVDSGTLTMNDAIVFGGSPASPSAATRYVGNGSGSSTDLASNVPTGGIHTWLVNAVEIIRITVAGIKSQTGKYFGNAGFFIRNDADSASNVAVTDAGAMTVRAGLTVTAGGATVSAGGVTVTGNSSVTGTLAATAFSGPLSGNATTATTANALAGTPANITGSRGGNAALASLLSGLAGLGLITDSTTP